MTTPSKLDEARLRELAADLLRVDHEADEWPLVLFQGRLIHIDNVLKIASDALSAERERGDRAGWRPIEDMPHEYRDGRWVQLWGGKPDHHYDGDESPPMVTAQYNPHHEGWQFAWYDSGYYGEWKHPTHFRPLPSPPLATQKAEGAET